MPLPPFVRASALLAIAVAAALATATGGHAASSNVTVTFDVASTTLLDLAGCPAGARAFGTVLAATPATTGSDCAVRFGATGAASRLRVRQQDGSGVGMFRWTDGAGDGSWGSGGVVDLGGGAGSDWLAGTVVTSTGHVLRGGNRGDDYVIARLTPAGALDTAGYGGGDGYATLDPTGVGAFNHAHAMDAFPDGSAVIVGHSTFSTNDATIIRFAANGSVDTTWGTGDDGHTNFSPGPGNDEPYDVQVQPDGSVLLAGHGVSSGRAWVAKLDADGLLDTSFGGGDGIAYQPVSAKDGRIVVDGITGDIYWSGQSGTTAFFAKFNRLGEPDTTWGTSGTRTINVPGMGSDEPGPGFIDSEGRLVVLGDGNGVLAFVIRLEPDGDPDPTFGTNGIVTHDPWGTDEIYFDTGEIVVKDGDRFCGGGNGQPPPTGAWRLYAACFNADGTIDTSFGTNGFAIFDATDIQSLEGGMWSRDGAIYLGGGENNRLVTIRMSGGTDQIPNYSHPGTTFASAGGAFGACLRAATNATATWTVAPGNACTGDGTHWQGVPATTAGANTEVATAASGEMNAVASLRFGVRTAGTAKGSYVAPLMFEVIAP